MIWIGDPQILQVLGWTSGKYPLIVLLPAGACLKISSILVLHTLLGVVHLYESDRPK